MGLGWCYLSTLVLSYPVECIANLDGSAGNQVSYFTYFLRLLIKALAKGAFSGAHEDSDQILANQVRN